MAFQNGYGPIDRFCAKHPRFGISHLMVYIIIIQAVVYVLDLITSSQASYLLMFYRPYIIHYGQFWRLITFVFVPTSSNIFYFLLGCYFYFWIGRMLEQEWGTAKFNLFYLSGVIISIIFGMFFGYEEIYYINLSIFLVIATLYGEMGVMLFFIIPIKMKWMALIDVVLIGISIFSYARMGYWMMALLPAASFVNYFIFTRSFWAERLGRARRKTDPQVINFKKAQRQVQKEQSQKTTAYRHKCTVCGITNLDDPNMEFRYCSKCDGYYCYCMKHINNHVHIRMN